MSKVAAYLQEHILGEVSSHPELIRRMSRDRSVLEQTPEMVIFPRATSDIRKAARFSWQLAEKGHVLPITPRGSGGDETGAAIGRGAVIATTPHMHHIFEYEPKQKLLRLQPGVSVEALRSSLALHGTAIPLLADEDHRSTMGGIIANNLTGAYGAKYGDMNRWVDQLEIVLGNGDVLQTGRISKRELGRRKGKQTFEGELYRAVDNLIDDNEDLLKKMSDDPTSNNAGYQGIAQVRRRDGSFDLTPLFVGSQGTLGIVSEMILKTEFMSFQTSVALIAFTEKTAARDATAAIAKLEPAFADYIDGELFAAAVKQGKKYDWFEAATMSDGAVIAVGFDDFNDRARAKKIKRLQTVFSDAKVLSATSDDAAPLMAARAVTDIAYSATASDQSWPPLFDDFYVPENRFEDFTIALTALATKHRVTLPLYGHILTSIYSCRPQLHLGRVGDKQKVFKLLDELASLIDHHDGYLVADRGEGRLKSKFTDKYTEQDERDLFAGVKAIFDPNGILNPGVKQDNDIRSLVAMLRSDYS